MERRGVSPLSAPASSVPHWTGLVAVIVMDTRPAHSQNTEAGDAFRRIGQAVASL